MSDKGVFVRKASGLVREISTIDSLIGNIFILNLVIGSATLVVIPFIFPGANMPLSVIYTFLLALPLAVVYVLFAIAMPRSGGDYIYVSRTLHPSLGFTANFTIMVWNMLWIGVYCNWVSTIGLSGTFAILGTVLNDAGFVALGSQVAQPIPAILIGTFVNVLMVVLVISGLKRTLLVQKILFIISIVGVFVAIFVVGSIGHDTFVQRFSALASYDGLIKSAEQSGMPVVDNWNQFQPTLFASLLVALSLLFAQFSQYAGGELKDVKKNVPVSILGSLVFGTIGIFLLALVANNTWGPNFMAAIQWLYYTAPNQYALSVPPTYNFLASISTPNIALIAIIGAGFALYSVGAIIFNHIVISRCVFSWAFDKVFPKKFSQVSEKYHSPVPALLLSFAVGEISLIYYSFNPTITFLAGSTLGFMLAFVTVAVAAIVFPYKLKNIYENSPAKIAVAGIPVISIAGVITVAWFFYMVYVFLVNPAFGANIQLGLFFMVFLWVIGFVLFYVSRYYRKAKEGTDIDLAFKELPPE